METSTSNSPRIDPAPQPLTERSLLTLGHRSCDEPWRLVDASQSELKTFHRCRGKWFTKYVRKLRPADTKPRLAIGGIFHDALADLHSSTETTPLEARNEKWMLERLGKYYHEKVPPDGDPVKYISKALGALTRAYFKEGPKKIHPFYATEVNFRIPIFLLDDAFEPVEAAGFLHGRLDVVERLEGPEEGLWITDYKTKDRFSFKGLEIDEQMSLYALAGAKLFGQDFRGVRLVYVRTELSARSANYANVAIVKQPRELRFIENNLAAQLRSMALFTADTMTWNFTRDCGWDCDYKDVCGVRRAGGDFEKFLRTRFVVREDDAPLEGDAAEDATDG